MRNKKQNVELLLKFNGRLEILNFNISSYILYDFIVVIFFSFMGIIYIIQGYSYSQSFYKPYSPLLCRLVMVISLFTLLL